MEQTKDEFWVLQTRIAQLFLAGQGATNDEVQTLVSLASIANGEIRARKQANAAPDLLAACEAALQYLTDKAADQDLTTEGIEAEMALLLVRLETEIAKAKGDQC